MKISETEILIVPGYKNAGPDHWQSRWERKLSTARRVEQEAWSKPECEDWTARLVEEVNRAERPVVLVAHSLGIPTSVRAIPDFRKRVAGAFFVAPPEVDNPSVRPKHMITFGPYPREDAPRRSAQALRALSTTSGTPPSTLRPARPSTSWCRCS